ncbi:MAG: hypothetical protein V3U96_07975 [Paracoccaceae bacterium]
MNPIEYTAITPEEYHAHEARAHELRAEAMVAGVVAITNFVKAQFIKFTHLFAVHKPA